MRHASAKPSTESQGPRADTSERPCGECEPGVTGTGWASRSLSRLESRVDEAKARACETDHKSAVPKRQRQNRVSLPHTGLSDVLRHDLGGHGKSPYGSPPPLSLGNSSVLISIRPGDDTRRWATPRARSRVHVVQPCIAIQLRTALVGGAGGGSPERTLAVPRAAIRSWMRPRVGDRLRHGVVPCRHRSRCAQTPFHTYARPSRCRRNLRAHPCAGFFPRAESPTEDAGTGDGR